MMAPSWPVHVFVGEQLIFPAKQLNFSGRQKTLQVFQRQLELSANLHCWRCPGAVGACKNILLPTLS